MKLCVSSSTFEGKRAGREGLSNVEVFEEEGERVLLSGLEKANQDVVVLGILVDFKAAAWVVSTVGFSLRATGS